MFGLRAVWLLVFWSLLYFVLGRLFQLLVSFERGDRAKETEVIALRRQVVVLRRQVNRIDLNGSDSVPVGHLRTAN